MNSIIKRLLIAALLALPVLVSSSVSFAGIDFDGIEDYVEVADSADWDFGAGEFSIAAWVRVDGEAGTNRQLIGQSDSGVTAASVSFWIQINSSNVASLRLNGSTVYLSSSTTFDVGEWHHLLYTRNATTLTVYVDGSSEATSGAFGATAVNNSGNKLGIGRLGEYVSETFNGVIEDVGIWNTELSATDAKLLGGSDGKRMFLQTQSTNLKGGWAIDDGPDGTSADGDTVRDISVNAHHGTADDGAGNANCTWIGTYLTYP